MKADVETSLELPFDNLPAEWQVASLGQVCSPSRETINPTAQPDELFEYYSIPAFQQSREPVITRGREILSQKLLVGDGTVLFGKLNPRVPKVWRVRSKSPCRKISSTEFLALSPGSNLDGDFLGFLCWSSYVMEVSKGLVGGSTPSRQRVDPAAFYEIKVPVPPLAEQRAIAAVLAKIQMAVEVQEKIVATLKELKAGTMAKLFREGLRGEPLKQTDIGEIPESWEVVRLGDVATIERGKFAHRPRNDPRLYGGTIPFIQTGDVARCNGRIRTYSQTLNEDGLAISRVFPKSTIVLTIAANIADTGILEFDSAFPDSLVGIVPGETVDVQFLECYLRTQKSEMDRLAPKGTQKNINIQFLKPWPTPRPSLDEQRGIAASLRCLDERLEKATARRDTLRVLFSSMLQLLMTGQVRVTPKTIAVEAFRSRQREARKTARAPDEWTIQEIVRRIVEAVAPEKVILFGSAARGEMGPNSDLDFLVVKSCTNRREVAQTIYRNLRGIGVPKDIVVVTPEDVERHRDTIGYIIRPALREGRVVYAR